MHRDVSFLLKLWPMRSNKYNQYACLEIKIGWCSTSCNKFDTTCDAILAFQICNLQGANIINSPKAFGELQTLLSPPSSSSPSYHSICILFSLLFAIPQKFLLPLVSLRFPYFAMALIDSTWPSLPKLALTCSNLPKLALTFPNLPKITQTFPKSPKLGSAWLSLALVILLSQCTGAC